MFSPLFFFKLKLVMPIYVTLSPPPPFFWKGPLCEYGRAESGGRGHAADLLGCSGRQAVSSDSATFWLPLPPPPGGSPTAQSCALYYECTLYSLYSGLCKSELEVSLEYRKSRYCTFPYKKQYPRTSLFVLLIGNMVYTVLSVQQGCQRFVFFVIEQFVFYCPSEKKLCFVSFLFEIQKQKKRFKYFDIEKAFFKTFNQFFFRFSFLFLYGNVSFLQNKICRIQQI